MWQVRSVLIACLAWYQSGRHGRPAEEPSYYSTMEDSSFFTNVKQSCIDACCYWRTVCNIFLYLRNGRQNGNEPMHGHDGHNIDENQEFYDTIDSRDVDTDGDNLVLPLSNDSEMRNRRQGAPPRYPIEDESQNPVPDFAEGNREDTEVGTVDVTIYQEFVLLFWHQWESLNQLPLNIETVEMDDDRLNLDIALDSDPDNSIFLTQ